MYTPILLTLLGYSYVASTPSVKLGPCKLGDGDCLKKSLNDALKIVFGGIPSLGIDSVDPMFQEVMNVDVSTLKLKLMNTTVKGFKDCTVDKVNFDVNALKTTYTLECPGFTMSGMYEVSGMIFTMPIEGTGSFDIITSGFSIPSVAELKLVKGDNGKMYLQATNPETEPKALGPIKYDLKNLFNGQKDRADPVLKYMNENWKAVADLAQGPIFKQNFDKIVTNYNKFLLTQPFDEIFTN